MPVWIDVTTDNGYFKRLEVHPREAFVGNCLLEMVLYTHFSYFSCHVRLGMFFYCLKSLCEISSPRYLFTSMETTFTVTLADFVIALHMFFFKLILGAITIQEQRGPWMNYIITQFLSSHLISIGNPIHDPFFWVSPKVIIQGVAMRRGRLMMMVGQSEWTPSFRETHLLFASVIACVWLSLCFPCRRNIS